MQDIAPNKIREALGGLIFLMDQANAEANATDGEVTDTLERFEALIEIAGAQAIELLCWSIRESAAVETACADEVRRLQGTKARATARAKRARAKILEVLDRRGETRATAGTFAVHTSKVAGKVLATGSVDPEQLPADLRRVTIDANLSAIGRLLKVGRAVDGYLLGPDSRSVVIR